MSWWNVGAAALGAVSSVAGGSSEKTYLPRSSTKAAERNRQRSMSSFLYGAPPSGRYDKVNTNSGTMTGGAEELFNNPENFMTYGPMPFAPANPYEMGAIQGYGDFATQAFPGMYGNYADATMWGLGGGQLGPYTDAFSGALGPLQNQFQAGAYQMNPGQFNPGIVSADPNAAINDMLSGDIDVTKLQGAMDSYLQPLMEQFNEAVLPSLQRADTMAAGGQSTAGALKASQRVLEDIGEGASAHAGGLLFNASRDALNRQERGAGLATNAGLSQYDMGLRGSGMQGGFNQDYTNSLLSGAGLGADTAYNDVRGTGLFASLMPQLMQTGMMGPEALQTAGGLARGLEQPYYDYAFNQHMFNQQQPFDMANSWYSMLQGMAPSGTPAPVQGGGSDLLGGLSAFVGGLGGIGGGGGNTGGGNTDYDPYSGTTINWDIFG